jgi:hypothetical protein
MQPTSQDNQLMSKHGVLSFKPQLRLEWRGQNGQNEAEQPDHYVSLGDSITSSTRIEFSVHTPTRRAVFEPRARRQLQHRGRLVARHLGRHRRGTPPALRARDTQDSSEARGLFRAVAAEPGVHVPNTREARRCSILNLSILISNGWRGTDKRLCNGPVHLPVIGWS